MLDNLIKSTKTQLLLFTFSFLVKVAETIDPLELVMFVMFD